MYYEAYRLIRAYYLGGADLSVPGVTEENERFAVDTLCALAAEGRAAEIKALNAFLSRSAENKEAALEYAIAFWRKNFDGEVNLPDPNADRVAEHEAILKIIVGFAFRQ